MAKEKEVVMIRAKVESASPERTQFKPYSTTLVFDAPAVYVDIPVPAEYVIERKGDRVVLSLTGWTIFLDTYASEVEKMNQRHQLSVQQSSPHRPY